MMSSKIPVTIVSGFLGAGKTTLINKVLKEKHGEHIAVVINEFGEIGVDHQFVLDVEEEIYQMDNGCLCCTLRTDIADMLKSILMVKEQNGIKVDRVLFETTGLADPAPIAQTFINVPFLNEHFILDAVLTVVDSKNFLYQTTHQTEPAKQVGFADKIFMSKHSLVDDTIYAKVINEVRSINPFAEIQDLDARPVEMKDMFGLELFYASEKKILEMQENSDFTLENQTESSAFSSPYEGEEAHTEVQSFQPSEGVQVESTIDPFEAMKVSLEPENTVESQSSIQMSSENNNPVMENALHEEMPTVKNESYDAQTSVAPFVQNADVPSPTLDTPMQTQTEQAQPSAFQQGVSLDTLAAQTPVQEVPQVQESVSQVQATPQMLSLDEMLAQPAAQVPQQVAPVMDLTSLTVGAQNSTNPLTNPTAYPTVQTAGNDGLMKKILAGVGGVVLVALAGVMVYIKYPLMFGSGGDTPQQPTTQSGTLQPQLALNTSGDQADHFAAGQE